MTTKSPSVGYLHYEALTSALGRPVKSYLGWLEMMLTYTESLLVAERETNEYLAELLLDKTRELALEREATERLNAALAATDAGLGGGA